MNRKYTEIINYVKGVEPYSVAVLDTGLYPHRDIKGRIIDFKDFVSDKLTPYDDNGHGTHISGIIGGDGAASKGKIRGAAIKSNIVGIKVLDKKGNGKVEKVIKAFDYVIKNKEKFNIKVVNISMGTDVKEADEEMTLLIEGVERMWENGLIVIAAAGNNGPEEMSITAPGVSRKIITVGSIDDDMDSLRGRLEMQHYSGRGPTCQCIVKPDIVTVGSSILSLGNRGNGYYVRSGTSMSTGLVSGIAAMYTGKYRDMTPKEFKLKLIEAAVDVGKPINVQGNGELEVRRLLK